MIILSADATCDLGDELKTLHNVNYFPYHLEYRGGDYLDNVDITPEEIYEGFYEDGSLPQTSAVNVLEYREHFEELTAQGDELIHVNLGRALSSSYEHAYLAARDMPHVHVIDSQNLSSGMGLLVLQAARMIEAGEDAHTIVKTIEDMRSRVHASFVLDTLEFMAAGGRCPQVLSHAGKALHLKVEIAVDNSDGSMHVSRLHHGSTSKSLKEYVRTQIKKNPTMVLDDVFITHSGAIDPKHIEVVRNELTERLPGIKRIHVTKASCTISAHCGPGTLGVLFVTED